jgi:hypothetical protein
MYDEGKQPTVSMLPINSVVARLWNRIPALRRIAVSSTFATVSHHPPRTRSSKTSREEASVLRALMVTLRRDVPVLIFM